MSFVRLAGFLLVAGAALVHAATPSTVALSSSANPSLLGQRISLTAVVSPSSASGKVTSYDNITVPSPLTSNLFVNPGAEDRQTGWWPSPSFPVFVVPESPPPSTGSYSFTGDSVVQFITQTVNLTQAPGITMARVDAGALTANYSFWFADPTPGSASHGEITLTFHDANGVALAQGISNKLQNTQGFEWLNGTGSFPIPAGTRALNYTMDFTLNGTPSDALMTIMSLQSA